MTVRQRVQLTPVSAVRVAAVVIVALALLTALDRSRLILNWLVTAAAAAVLLDGLVRVLLRWTGRGLAVAAVTLLTLAGAALLTYGVVDAAFDQYDALRETAPEAAQALEDSDVVGGLARGLQLVDRTTSVVDGAPQQLFGSPADAAQTAAQGLGQVALVITLTVFILVAYERFEQRVLDLDEASRRGLGRLVGLDAGVASGARSARRTVGRVVLLGAAVGAVAAVADVRAPIALGLWMAWWRLLPLAGVVVGYAPLLLLLATDRPRVVAVVVLVVLAAAEAGLWWGFHRPSASRLPVPMGALAVVAFSGGFEMAGVVGAVVAVVVTHVVVGAVWTAMTTDVGEVADDAVTPPVATPPRGRPGSVPAGAGRAQV